MSVPDVMTIETVRPISRPTIRPFHKPVVPPLEAGERLTRHEFERRYEAMPHLKKAELIEGVVYMPSPVRASHSQAHGEIIGWLATYCAATPGIRFGDNATVRLDARNEVQPDVFLCVKAKAGGRSRVSADDYIEGAPELIVEVALSGRSYDLREKLCVYRRHEVQEYIVWQVYDARVTWFALVEGESARLQPDADGVIRSRVFPGLRLAVSALVAGDLAAVLVEVRQGVASPEHATFVAEVSAHLSQADP
jgi:Uma2 family endonuclease